MLCDFCQCWELYLPIDRLGQWVAAQPLYPRKVVRPYSIKTYIRIFVLKILFNNIHGDLKLSFSPPPLTCLLFEIFDFCLLLPFWDKELNYSEQSQIFLPWGATHFFKLQQYHFLQYRVTPCFKGLSKAKYLV